MAVRTPHGTVRAAKVLLATSAFPPLLRRMSAYVVPVWDYALMTEPIPADVRASLGWQGRQGIGDAGNRFHYYRLVRGSGGFGGVVAPGGGTDDRLLFGGYDALYFWGGKTDRRLEQHPETFRVLAEHLVDTFPQLAETRISHAWGGAIDTCSRFSAFWGQALGGPGRRTSSGSPGWGSAPRISAPGPRSTCSTGATPSGPGWTMVRTKPIPFPPEPLRWTGIQLTRASLARADEHGGRRNLWLRALDAVGLGFDS